VPHLLEEGATILDVRTPDEIKYGSIKGSLNIEIDQLRQRLDELPSKDTPIYVMCRVGHRGYVATVMLQNLGYTAYNIDGGYELYKAAIATY
jgi:rhodanese-related sulfurtransferase